MDKQVSLDGVLETVETLIVEELRNFWNLEKTIGCGIVIAEARARIEALKKARDCIIYDHS